MSDIERELREVLQHKQPPAGFERRVEERAAIAQRSRRHSLGFVPAAVAVCLLTVVGGASWQRERQGKRAKDQLLLALQITGQELNRVERLAAKNLGKQEQ
jgi:hypothetical protein